MKSEVTYLGLHLDQRLTWQAHIKVKRQQLNLRVKKYYWLLGKSSQLSAENKLLLYKTIIKPIWTYGIELCGCSKPSNTKILQAFQSKTLHTDLSIPYINEVITNMARKSRERNLNHHNPLIANL